MKKYDAIIVGFGKGGKTITGYLAKQGWKVAIIEESKEMYGGTCINVGCIPSKSLVVHSDNTSYEEAVQIKETLITKLRKKNYDKLNDLENVDVIDGKAKFISNKVISVNGEELEAKYIFINTGSKSVIPNIKGADLSRVYTSSELMKLDKLPKRLAIIGGGYIGLEFANMYARYGSEVTVYEYDERLIRREDIDIANEIQSMLESRNVKFVFSSMVKEFKENSNGVEVLYANRADENNILSETYDGILLATGRKANTADLGLENTDVKTDERGNIIVNEYLETDVKDTFALGDVKGGLQFTYISLDDYRIVRDYIFGDKKRTTLNRKNIPYSVFITPTFSRVGLSEEEARNKGYNVKVGTLKTAAIPRANVDGKPEGILKAVVDADTNKILGCVLICEKSEEIINFVQLAMNQNMDYQEIANHIFTHPSVSEALNDLFSSIK